MTGIIPSAYKENSYVSRKSNSADNTDGRPRFKVGYITAPATADDGDEITIDMFDEFGITTLMAIEGFIHTTTDSVVLGEQPTTVVDGTRLVITVGGSTDDKKRFYAVYGI